MSEDTSVLHTGKPLSEEFNDDFQNRLAAYFCRDFQFTSRAGDLVEPDQFSSAANGFLVDLVGSYFKMYRSIPSTKVLVELVLQANKRVASAPSSCQILRRRLPAASKSR
jgi:replicative DNA helicase